MDEDRLKGAATNLGGKVKDAVGGVTGDTKLQGEGKADQVSGRVQNTYGSAKDTVRDEASSLGAQIDVMMKERPVTALFAAVAVGYVLARLAHR